MADSFELRACLADKCLCSQNINKYSNKPTKGYERFEEDFGWSFNFWGAQSGPHTHASSLKIQDKLFAPFMAFHVLLSTHNQKPIFADQLFVSSYRIFMYLPIYYSTTFSFSTTFFCFILYTILMQKKYYSYFLHLWTGLFQLKYINWSIFRNWSRAIMTVQKLSFFSYETIKSL